MPINIEALLQPIPGGDPCGADLRYLPVTPLIKEARREEADISQGVRKHDTKVADFPQVLKLSKEALTKQGKDLQVAAWLTEALLRMEGFAGLRQGLELIRRMLETYWDGVHPRPDEDGDLVMRATALRWVGSQLDSGVRSAPVTKAHNWYQYRESRTVPTEEEAQSSGDKLALRNEAIQEGKTTPEEFDNGFAATPGAWSLELYKSLGSLLELIASLGSYCDEKFGDETPEFSSLSKSLEEIYQTARVLMKQKGISDEVEKPAEEASELEPEPAYAEPVYAEQSSAPASQPQAAAPRPARPSAMTAEPSSREDAEERVRAAGRYLRREDPYSPAGYMVTRALRWGELRMAGTNPHPQILVAPPTEVRVGLKQLALEGVNHLTLEAAEDAAGRPWGRAWLDIHRYSVASLQASGADLAAKAILSGLRALLQDVPSLLDWSLADDTPVANAETRQWLKDTGTLGGADGSAAVAPPPPPPEPVAVAQPEESFRMT